MSTATIKDWRDYPPGKEKYQLYLASREWAVIKEKVRTRSRGRCERCFDDTAANVHHQTYERIYQEKLEDLVHVCIPCHEFLSGKLNDDPFLSSPVMINGTRFKTVYLAGKITGTTWRDEIMPNWSKQVTKDVLGGDWATIERSLPIPDGRLLDFAGPFWRPTGWKGDQGFGSSADVQTPHAFSMSGLITHHDQGDGADMVFAQIIDSIIRSDLIFAWIDSLDCFGTLVELGYARGLGKQISIACPHSFRDHLERGDLWLAAETVSQWVMVYDSPKQAWDSLFSPERLRLWR